VPNEPVDSVRRPGSPSPPNAVTPDDDRPILSHRLRVVAVSRREKP
jgi:hypothetical protein